MTEAERKMRILVRDDVKMSRGKYAAQAVHAALLAVGAHPDVPVIVLGCDEEGIESMATVVRDAGRTEVEPGTVTAGTDWVTPSDAQAKLARIRDLCLRNPRAWLCGAILDYLDEGA